MHEIQRQCYEYWFGKLFFFLSDRQAWLSQSHKFWVRTWIDIWPIKSFWQVRFPTGVEAGTMATLPSMRRHWLSDRSQARGNVLQLEFFFEHYCTHQPMNITKNKQIFEIYFPFVKMMKIQKKNLLHIKSVK